MLAREGASVVAADLSEEHSRDTVQSIGQLGGNVITVNCDVTSSDQVGAAVLWVCSGDATFTMGHALVVDGGQTV